MFVLDFFEACKSDTCNNETTNMWSGPCLYKSHWRSCDSNSVCSVNWLTGNTWEGLTDIFVFKIKDAFKRISRHYVIADSLTLSCQRSCIRVYIKVCNINVLRCCGM